MLSGIQLLSKTLLSPTLPLQISGLQTLLFLQIDQEKNNITTLTYQIVA